MKAITTILLCGTAALALSGCDRIGSPLDTLTGNRPTPDEFRVVTRKPLNMPGSTALPEPRLGERSPLEHDPNADARVALTGDPSGGSASVASAGEQALLQAANANANNRATGERLVAAEAALTTNEPYEPPTVLELLNLDGEKAENVIDPNAEARRLLTTGASPTPVNPDDLPAEAEAEDDGYVSPGEKYTPKFPYGSQRKGS